MTTRTTLRLATGFAATAVSVALVAGALHLLRGREDRSDSTSSARDAGAPEEDVPLSGPLVSLPRLDVTLPAGWIEERRPDGKLRYAPKVDGSAGELVVMRQPEDSYLAATHGKSLGGLAIFLGTEIELGKPGPPHDELAAMGTLGYAMFQGAQPATFFAVTLSPTSVYTWTWAGPDPNGTDVTDAIAIARSAKEAKNAETGALAAFVGNLETLSQAHAMVRDGTDPKEVYAATFVDEKGALAAEERPAIAGVLAIAGAADGPNAPDAARADAGLATALHQSFRLNFDADPSHALDLTVSLAATPKLGEDEAPRVHVVLARAKEAWKSELLRRRAIALWALPPASLGPPADAAAFEAVVLGTHMIRSRRPAYFTSPGGGAWILFKTMQPGELYLALDLEAGLVEIIPKKPEEPTEAARRLYQLF
jgi:hypothetical protein